MSAEGSDSEGPALESFGEILAAIGAVSLDAFRAAVPRVFSPADARLTAAAAAADRADIVAYLDETFPAAAADRKAILAAAEAGAVRTMRYLIGRGRLDGLGPAVWQQVLERAVCSVDMIRMFMDGGRDFRHERYVARAIRIGAWDSVRFLVASGANMQQTAALLAAARAPGSVVRKMREAGCHFGTDAVPAALGADNVDALKVLRNFGLVSAETLADEARAAGARACEAYAVANASASKPARRARGGRDSGAAGK